MGCSTPGAPARSRVGTLGLPGALPNTKPRRHNREDYLNTNCTTDRWAAKITGIAPSPTPGAPVAGWGATSGVNALPTRKASRDANDLGVIYATVALLSSGGQHAEQERA